MNMLNKEPERHEIEALLPWHAAGTLNRRDADRVELFGQGHGRGLRDLRCGQSRLDGVGSHGRKAVADHPERCAIAREPCWNMAVVTAGNRGRLSPASPSLE